jgi:hypothetical protein
MRSLVNWALRVPVAILLLALIFVMPQARAADNDSGAAVFVQCITSGLRNGSTLGDEGGVFEGVSG